ncbi:uncharacterized protein Z520_09064 [Fonsecaea multimorphosa CBS 102226]|uniref:Uncharacterized protein n=1 Tax=Fonsecaea multimorphosa CBS 102226 TaxID=1442371 RepID=A0A0D2KEL6_9EURO|nr:uncharacterized protein Z520_09064 [Fonsecaea multimorphosa CBS 102226]KIX95148.1 hypothetical protein Z520_09064 [Fonsecaea multimorphosa CBS 102226]OAL20868.1 hypothetical protein AYO22_08496 [Fonsecaea multimorphosa]
MSSFLPENEPQIQPRNPFARPGPIPDIRLEGLYLERPPSLVQRAEPSSSSSSPSTTTSCGPNDDSGACEKYYGSGSSTTLPIVLGVVIPLGIALILLIYLHRRHVKKLRREDAEDKHKSLDFGLLESKQNPQKKTGPSVPEMSMAKEKEAGGRRGRGLSLDMGANNPYLLPPELHHSRESLHSLSRSINTGDDKYRATTFVPDDGSIRPPSSLRSPIDDSSSYTGSSTRRFPFDSKQNLLRNAQEPANGLPPSGRSTPAESAPGSRNPAPPGKTNNLLLPTMPDPVRDSFVSTASSNGAVNALRASNNYLGQFIFGGGTFEKEDPTKKGPVLSVKEVQAEAPVAQVPAPPPAVLKDAPPSLSPHTTSTSRGQTSIVPGITLNAPEERQPRLPQLSFIDSQSDRQQTLASKEEPHTALDTSKTPQGHEAPSMNLSRSEASHDQTSQGQHQVQQEEEDYYDEYEAYGDQDQQYHDDHGYYDYQDYDDYTEYDPRRLTMGLRPLPPDDPSENPEQRANRIRSFYKEYFDDSKPQNHAQNMQYYDGAEGYYQDNYAPGVYQDGYYDQAAYYPPRGMSQTGTYGRHRATVSNGSYQSGPRAFSSASGRYGGHPRMPPKKNLPPPKPLNVLPTPSKLKEDTFLPIDFAPPQKIYNQRAGTPDSLRGGLRPYSPAVRAHIPLASSFDDLAVIPSPHQLRKSSTFTALDFAPPSRLKANDTGSETGSIRSNRSGISAIHLHNIRTGAYRVSRIPKEVAGTRDELVAALRPQWDLNR